MKEQHKAERIQVDMDSIESRLASETVMDRGDGYEEFRAHIALRVATTQWPLFTTDANPDNLWQTFIGSLPRWPQHYNCRACQSFIKKYGGLVTIDSKGEQTPLLWSNNLDLPYFRQAEFYLWGYVQLARVTGVFVNANSIWGTPETPPWTHFYGKPGAAHHKWKYSSISTAAQAMAEYKEDFKMLSEALGAYRYATFETAVRVLQHDSLYRGQKFVEHAQWLLLLSRHLAETPRRSTRDNLVWRAVAIAPVGWCHVKSSMLGSLLEDIKAGYSFGKLKDRFEEKMHPLKYQRPQVVKEGTIDKAEKLIDERGLRDSLKRRFAYLSDIDCFWRPTPKKLLTQELGVFGHLRESIRNLEGFIKLPTQHITWVKFKAEVLPEAHTLAYKSQAYMDSFTAMVAPLEKSAPPLLQWRNGISWYLYYKGSFGRDWNITREWTPILGLARHPGTWGHLSSLSYPGDFQDNLAFFLLEGCRDLRYPGAGGGFFPSHLRSDLHEVRAVLEAYSNKAEVQGATQASACGVLKEKGHKWNIILRVNGIDDYLIDRWD